MRSYYDLLYKCPLHRVQFRGPFYYAFSFNNSSFSLGNISTASPTIPI